MSIYEVTIHASTLSIVNEGLYINGTPTEAYQVRLIKPLLNISLDYKFIILCH